ncbi:MULTISPECIES: hypothetical protein [unclassified Microcoleus]|uniref:hypothetical protein n=1 Tax=unclassified Microcoleus TaxID=2642155 RepID=UPI0025F133DE|nr:MULTISPECIES: hypothetical protein [unclassified Microcoleus]
MLQQWRFCKALRFVAFQGIARNRGKIVKGVSIFRLMVGLAVVGFGQFSKPQLAARANQSLVDSSVTANSDVINKPQTVAQQPNSGLITWREFIERGGRRFVDRDYDLPTEFRNGYLYINAGADNTTGYILKQGLSTYPPVKSEVREIDYEEADSYVKSGKAIKFNWGGGAVSGRIYGKDTELRFVKETGQFCLRLTCLEAPFMTKQEINKILRSERRISQKK